MQSFHRFHKFETIITRRRTATTSKEDRTSNRCVAHASAVGDPIVRCLVCALRPFATAPRSSHRPSLWLRSPLFSQAILCWRRQRPSGPSAARLERRPQEAPRATGWELSAGFSILRGRANRNDDQRSFLRSSCGEPVASPCDRGARPSVAGHGHSGAARSAELARYGAAGARRIGASGPSRVGPVSPDTRAPPVGTSRSCRPA